MLLHVTGPETTGGAFQATNSVVMALGGSEARFNCLPTRFQQAYRGIGGYCDPRAVKQLRNLIHTMRSDAIHLHNFKCFGTAAIRAAVLESVPAIWHCYDYFPFCPRDTLCMPGRICAGRCPACYQPKGRAVPLVAKTFLLGRKRRILRHLNQLSGVVALSQHSAGLLYGAGVRVPIQVERLQLQMPKIEVERMPYRVLFVGWQSPNKGRQVFTDAVNLLKMDVDPYALDTAVERPRGEVLSKIAEAKVVVIPEQWPNPCPIVLLEAKALGTPVVASRIGGIPEFVGEGDILCAPDSPQEFADAIATILHRGVQP